MIWGADHGRRSAVWKRSTNNSLSSSVIISCQDGVLRDQFEEKINLVTLRYENKNVEETFIEFNSRREVVIFRQALLVVLIYTVVYMGWHIYADVNIAEGREPEGDDTNLE